MPCTKSTGQLPLVVAHECSVRGNPYCLWVSPIYLGITLLMFFVLVVMGCSFQNQLGRPILMAPISERPFPICIYYLIRYVEWQSYSRGTNERTNLYFCLQDLIPTKPTQAYVPRIYGFRVNESSPYYRNREDDGRMQADAQSRSSRRSRRQGR